MLLKSACSVLQNGGSIPGNGRIPDHCGVNWNTNMPDLPTFFFNLIHFVSFSILFFPNTKVKFPTLWQIDQILRDLIMLLHHQFLYFQFKTKITVAIFSLFRQVFVGKLVRRLRDNTWQSLRHHPKTRNRRTKTDASVWYRWCHLYR